MMKDILFNANQIELSMTVILSFISPILMMILDKLSRTMRMVNNQQLPVAISCAHDDCEVLSAVRALSIALKEFMPQNHDISNRKKSDARSSERLHVTNTPGWKGYVILGCLLFMIFYWMIPAWLNHELSTLQHSSIRPIAETLFIRRIYWIQLAGVALSSLCIFFAMRNYFSKRAIRKSIGNSGGGNINFFSRLIAKLID